MRYYKKKSSWLKLIRIISVIGKILKILTEILKDHHVRIAWLTAREPSAFYDFTVFAQDYITKTEHPSQARARPVRALEVSRYQTDKFTTMK